MPHLSISMASRIRFFWIRNSDQRKRGGTPFIRWFVVYSTDLSRAVHTYEVGNRFNTKGKDGATKFLYPGEDSIAFGFYKKDRPYQGKVFVNDELCDYSEGVKNGVCLQYDKDGKLRQLTNYSNDVKEGAYVCYAYPEVGVVRGTFQNGQPLEGDFHEGTGLPIITSYDEGAPISQKVYRGRPLKLYSLTSMVDSTITFYDDQGATLYTGILKNGKPFAGTFPNGQTVERYRDGKEWFNNKFTFFYLFFFLSAAAKSLADALHRLRFSPYIKKK